MAKVRQDAWSHEDDLLLAETVLRHIREGSTQLNAFEEVGDKLNRTSAACGFRWNAEVRQNYDQAVAIAKRQRKQNKRHQLQQQQKDASTEAAFYRTVPVEINEQVELTKQIESRPQVELDLTSIISYLKQLKAQSEKSYKHVTAYASLENKYNNLVLENEKLAKQAKSLEAQLENVQEDYQTFLKIMDRARKMVVFSDEDDKKLPSFVMDKNGNLEQVAK
ncbi:prespore-specific regulator [Amphibacillus marinus]|uniref:Prespore-specific regulator n=1 Tax=Amphibacillus marinus TaxID=872970 RepID=A0A1H8NXR0_9BACI|nr:RsfA family transcriptional regulator [Amphibacillus marinus]SEO34425.1 prespore-specific regulator [Amphibacillus marinus]